MKIAFILTSYNRKATTIKCLEQLEKISKGKNVSIFLTDDNSPDNTFEEVRKLFPDVHITKSLGNLYWNRGMYVTWIEALKYDYDVYIWVNDDNTLFDDALNEIIACAEETDFKAIICGCFSDENGNFAYGGLNKDLTKIIPDGKLHPVYYMNGNFVLVPKDVVKKIGILDPVFVHMKGDYDYGLTAIEAGVDVLSTKTYIGINNVNPVRNSRGRRYGKTFKGRVHDSLHSPFMDNPVLSLYFNIKHKKGVVRSTLIFIKAFLVHMLPDRIYKFLH